MNPVHTWPREVDAEVSMPKDLHESIRYAIPKLNMCDYVSAVFLPHLTNVLQQINARADWLIVELQPHFLLRFAGYELPEHQAHSTFSITTSSGEQFVADFTMEQFGFHPQYWLSSKTDYLNWYTVNCEYRLHTDEETTVMKSYADYDSLAVNLQRATDAVVGAFDRQAYSQLPIASRRPWIRAAVRDTFASLGIPTS
ncbi:hypothetical protein J1614_005318 [Plenodomus biglobosus]|nr:hypothetical protein J1614_005318 [Plenodomus biglobosus]